jgi:alkylated DNA repair dioxygenase AlkB
MSETLSSIEFNKQTADPREVMDAVAREGAVVVHDFLPLHQLQRGARALEVADWWTDETNAERTVARHHDLTRFGFSSRYPWPVAAAGAGFPPEPIFNAARRISDFVNAGAVFEWDANEIIGHRYNEGDFIDKHRDYARALGFVAVLTLEGSQRFSFERDAGDIGEVDMNPGTLSIMRGFQPETRALRPYHWVAPATERRLAISLRQMRVEW